MWKFFGPKLCCGCRFSHFFISLWSFWCKQRNRWLQVLTFGWKNIPGHCLDEGGGLPLSLHLCNMFHQLYFTYIPLPPYGAWLVGFLYIIKYQKCARVYHLMLLMTTRAEMIFTTLFCQLGQHQDDQLHRSTSTWQRKPWRKMVEPKVKGRKLSGIDIRILN